eukprot:CAMPEP_0194775738 /NCGR_PEP_ID=MMETSP0323_2-20130528/61156_1 /TAXON_ID=2866 ORGANISM="Crypthecodinium cohnii, Strain Seligo" /NCGR_SAMPLE_ID=MMETSP0323_2 /ASSEMBLY_ACC=CAM_ASM_000346 /LENGTH=57 /DNA_ID=CAMNT_0039711841 /DNA_START=221 /DNA_END=394 /DNA_ORIENTATION=+
MTVAHHCCLRKLHHRSSRPRLAPQPRCWLSRKIAELFWEGRQCSELVHLNLDSQPKE